VAIHAALASWAKWTEFRRMIGMGWGSNKSGFGLAYDDAGQLKRIPPGEGRGSAHGIPHEYPGGRPHAAAPDPQGPPAQVAAQLGRTLSRYARAGGKRAGVGHRDFRSGDQRHVDADGANVITAVDGRPVRTAEELARQFAEPSKSGLRLLTVRRGGKEAQVKIMTPKTEK
jgi:hypothetical protein